jgi:hypothetical protein
MRRRDFTAQAENPRTGPRRLARLALAWGGEPSILVKLAGNPRTPPATLILLLQRPEPDIRRAVLEHPSLPSATLAMWQLAHDLA